MGWRESYLGTLASIESRVFGTAPKPEERNSVGPFFSISDPALAEYLGLSSGNSIEASETRALGIPAYYRAVNIVAGTVAGLPLKTYRQMGDSKERVGSFLDNPAAPYKLSPYAWKELVMLNLLNQGEVFLLHNRNLAGGLIGLWPIHRNAVEVRWSGYEKIFKVHLADGGTVEYGEEDMTQIMALTLDGLRGVAPITLFRQSIKLGLAGELAATRSFTNGLLIAGLVTPVSEDIEEEEGKLIKEGLQAKISGVEHAGDIAFVNRALKFSPWAMSNEDAQFVESREFQREEFAIMLGVPTYLVGAQEKQTSWGTGIGEQNLSLAKFTLMSWTSRIEEALSTLLPSPRFCEFEYKGLLQGTPEQEVKLLIEQVKAGLITVNEARAIQNLPPLANPPTGSDATNGNNNV